MLSYARPSPNRMFELPLAKSWRRHPLAMHGWAQGTLLELPGSAGKVDVAPSDSYSLVRLTAALQLVMQAALSSSAAAVYRPARSAAAPAAAAESP